jgi:hypothetical protein
VSWLPRRLYRIETHPRRIGVTLPGQNRIEFRDRDRVQREKIDTRCAERVIHHSVELVPPEPGGPVIPDLTQYVCVGIDGFHKPPPLDPEFVRDLVRYIESPSVDPGGEPVAGDVEQVLPDCRIPGHELREAPEPPPAVVVGLPRGTDGETVDFVPSRTADCAPFFFRSANAKKSTPVWLNTPSRITRMPRLWQESTSSLKTFSSPNAGSIRR